MSEELKSCPFCGSDDIAFYNGWKFGNREKDGGEFRSPSICCGKCRIGMTSGSYGFGISDEYVKKDISEKWNNRAND